MAKSLDGLIRHLVDQIALCGEYGATTLDFITHVKNYYVTPTEDSQTQTRDHLIAHPGITPNVDRPFLEQVWKWLLRNPDIRIGSHARHKQLTLSEVEARNADIEQSGHPLPVSQETQLPTAVGPSHGSNPPTITQDADISQTQQGAEAASAITENAAAPQGTKFNPGIRLYASKNRMWHALTGHAPDFDKVKSLDFICLSIIAACGPKGILQHDLVRISGQDKRSLPARTDRLHDGGYVEKKRVSVELFNPKRLVHTSQCTLKRFVKDIPDQKQQTSDPDSTPAEKAKREKKKAQRDRRSQAPGQSSSTVALESVPESTASSEGRTIPSWTADRPINNQIFELVDRAGIKGMSMTEIRDALMGDHIKKPLDEYVSRLVQSWQISQPLHIRHLSIVRDTVLKGKTQIYMYYTYDNFKKLVEGGTGFWEAVTTIPSEVMIGKNVAASLNAKPDVDEYGFPKLEENLFQGRHNDATLSECVAGLKVDPLHISVNDPVLKKQPDGNYGVWYKSQQKHPVTNGNGSSPQKATSTPSQAMSIKTRATEPKKVSLSSPSDGLSIKSHIVETQEVAVPKPPSVVSANGRVPGPRVEKRKYVRNPDSKPRGRPRKYPKTGMPANLDTMTPDEVDYLVHSQEMFEKYEIVKMEKEIVRRIEDGEDAAIVAYEVLAECDNSRKQEGELPLPKTSRAQVLHNFAGEPLPEPDSHETKPNGRHRINSERRDPEEGPPVLLTRTRGRGRDVSGLEPKIYLPSVAAHSWPYVRPCPSAMETSTAEALHNSTKPKQGRPAKPKQLPSPQFKYLPSIASHSGSFLPVDTAKGQKRKRTSRIPIEGDEESTVPLQYRYLPSIAAHSGSFLPPDALQVPRAGQKRQRTASVLSQHYEHYKTPGKSSAAIQEPRIMPAQGALPGTSTMALITGNEGMYPGWEKFMSKHYQQQLETITRSNTGIFLGKTTPRRKRPCEPRDFRPTHFKLVVFKSTRLSELDWYVKKTIASEHVSSVGSRAQTPRSQVAEPTPLPIMQSPSEGQPKLSKLTSLPSPALSHLISPPNSSHVSPYVDITGMKRKRTTSPEPTRGAAPFDPFTASPFNRHSSPGTESIEPISRPSTPPRTAVLSSAIDHVHRNAFIETEAPNPELPRQPDSQELSEPTPSAPILNNPTPTQSKCATSLVKPSSQSPTPEVSKPLDKESINKISRRGGSVAMLRKNIIMAIVEKCEGVFPSHKEMCSPFAAEWKKRGQQGTPEAKTISNAVNALIKEHKLRQITFAAQARQGSVVTKSMLILPTIDPTDPKVKEIQTNMAAFHPRHFVPMAVLPPEDHQSAEIHDNTLDNEEASDKMTKNIVQESSTLEASELRRLDRAKKMMAGKQKAAMVRLKALKEPDQQGLERTDIDEPSVKPFLPRAIKDGADVESGRGSGRNTVPKATPERSSGRRGQKRGQRLASIKKNTHSYLATLPTIPLDPVSNSVPLTWMPSIYAFSSFNFEEQRPTVLTATPSSDLQTSILEAPGPSDRSNKARKRIRMLAENAARIERKQALANTTKSSLLHMDVDSGQLESPYALIRPRSPSRHAPTSGTMSSNKARPRNQRLPNAPHAGEATFDRTVRPEDNLGQEDIGLEAMMQLQPTPEPLPREDISRTASPSPESPSSCVSKWPVFTHTKDNGRLNTRVLLVSFMDPVHYFHRATGTFSVTFSGLRPPRRILAHRGTALNPYAASLKAVQPYNSYRRSSWPLSLQGSHLEMKTLFEEEVDNLLRRELEANELDNVLLIGWPFINHVFPHTHQTVQAAEADMEAAKQVTVRLNDGRLLNRRFSRDKNSRLRISNSIFSIGNRGIDPAKAESQPSLKRRRLTSVIALKTQEDILKQVELDHEHRPSKLRRVRGPRQARSLGENGEERLLTAVMVIRALTGGLDKRIDWVLVAKVFEPTYTQMFVHSRWNHTLQKYKLVLPKMESDFQSIFASAYEEGTVPTLDYDNLEKYDWKWLVEWTMANVDTPTQSLPELPVERPDFDALFSLNETSKNEINEVYEIDGSTALARRVKVMHRDPYVLPLVQGQQRARPEDTEDLRTARSWIRANIMTPESTYNPSAARAKLSTFPDRVVEDALKQLLLDRVLTQENKGRLIPGRNYDISDFLISRLQKNLQSAHFHRAAAYKQRLDHDFKEKGFANYSYAAEDGDMIVIINLQAHKRISIVPIGVPMNKWGQTDGGYETRQMDKRRLNFSLELRPSPTYIFGDPLSPLPAPPSRHLQDPTAKIPLWYDIHDSLVTVMWEMALAAIVAVLAVRPGIGATELEEVMRPAMEAWELQEALEWLVSAKAAKKVGQGFSVEDEWWWLALGTGESSEECAGEDVGDRERRTKLKGKGKEKARGEEGAQDEIIMD